MLSRVFIFGSFSTVLSFSLIAWISLTAATMDSLFSIVYFAFVPPIIRRDQFLGIKWKQIIAGILVFGQILFINH